MHAPHELTWLDWLFGAVVFVLWNFGPALARDALDSYFDRPRHRTRRRKDRAAPGPARKPPGGAAAPAPRAWRRREIASTGSQAPVDPPPTTPEDLLQGEARELPFEPPPGEAPHVRGEHHA
jgi:hypothetical protein